MGYSPWGCKELDTTGQLSTGLKHEMTVVPDQRGASWAGRKMHISEGKYDEGMADEG